MPSISSNTQQNLVANSYLHSNPFNFTNAVAIATSGSTFNLENQLTLTKSKMEKSLGILKSTEQRFYSEMGVSGYKEFNSKFREVLTDYECLRELRTPEFADFIGSSFLERVAFISEQLGDRIDIDEKDIDKLEKQIVDMVNNYYVLGLNEQRVRTAFSAKKGKKSTSRPAKNISVRLDKIMFEKGLEEEAIKKGILVKDLGDASIEYLRTRGYEVSLQLQQVLKSSFEDMKNKINLKVTDQNNLLGVVGEFQAQVLFNLVLGKLSVKDKMRKALYTGADKDVSTGRQSSIDFLIGKYGIQVKNTKRDLVQEALGERNRHTINLIREVSLDTFADRIPEGDLYKYLVENILFLSQYGLDKDGNPSNLDFSQERVSKIIDFVTSILDANSQTLLHAEVGDIFSEEANRKTTTSTYGNVFFLFGGEYLIPVSLMLEGIMKQMIADLNRMKEEVGIGNYVYNGKVGIENYDLGGVQIVYQGNSVSAQELQQEKKIEASRLDGGDEYTYPENIMSIGRDAGNSVRSGLKVKVSYNYNLKKLLDIAEKISIR